jgi:hypothetical protein
MVVASQNRDGDNPEAHMTSVIPLNWTRVSLMGSHWVESRMRSDPDTLKSL